MINVVLFQPEIPNNTGNIIRICSATNAKLHIIKPIAFDLSPKYLKRAAAGRLLEDIKHEIHESYQKFDKKYNNKKVYFITRYGLKNFSDVSFKKEIDQNQEIWLMFGRESTGIPKEIMQKSLETCLRIPMVPSERSLNLANTVMLLVYEIHRQTGYKGLSKYEVQKGKNFIKK